MFDIESELHNNPLFLARQRKAKLQTSCDDVLGADSSSSNPVPKSETRYVKTPEMRSGPPVLPKPSRSFRADCKETSLDNLRDVLGSPLADDAGPVTPTSQAYSRPESAWGSRVTTRHKRDVGHWRSDSVTDMHSKYVAIKPDEQPSRIQSAKHIITTLTSSPVCYWSWRDGRNKWHLYDDERSELIDSLYLVDPKSSLQLRFYYLIDFKTMLQTNYLNGRKRAIRRTDIRLPPKKVVEQRSTEECITKVTVEPSLVLPATWKSDPNDNTSGFKLIEVSRSGETAKEFTEIAELFEKTMGKGRLKTIKRIENHNLYVAFQLYRTQMENERKQTVDVRRLFHGTKDQFIEVICRRGFDCRIAGSSGGTVEDPGSYDKSRYGQGSYFARDASYSEAYSTDSRKMFLVQVNMLKKYTDNVSSVKVKCMYRFTDETNKNHVASNVS